MKLERRSVRVRTGLLRVEGAQAVSELLQWRPSTVQDVYFENPTGPLWDLANDVCKYVHAVSPAVSKAVSDGAQGVFAVCSSSAVEPMEFDGLGTIVVLPKAQDPGNAGTIVRAADAFGAAGVVACVGTVDLTSPKVIRMSTGSVFHLGIREGMVFEQAIEQAKASGLMVCGTAMEGEPLTALPGDTNIAWVFGNEAKGLSEEEKSLCDRLVSIPMSGNAESLNVSVAAGICLYQSQELRNGR